MEIGKIINGHINEALNLNADISKQRMQICYMCPLFVNMLGGICNRQLWLNPNTGDVSTEQKDGYKRGCGCRVRSKTRLVNEQCPLGKW